MVRHHMMMMSLVMMMLGETTNASVPWPLPWSIRVGHTPLTVDTQALQVTCITEAHCSSCDKLSQLPGATARFHTSIRTKVAAGLSTGVPQPNGVGSLTEISLCVLNASDWLGFGTNESYTLDLGIAADGKQPAARVTAGSIYGAIHALESMLQLVEPTLGWIVNAPVSIADQPRYRYRGLLIDTGRHYLPMPMLHKIIDGMAQVKLNVLHWHITDIPSVPFKFEKYPQLQAHAAFAPTAVYTATDAHSIVEYAKQRGVRVVAEIDMPGHGGWYRAIPELGVNFCPDVLDPTSNRTYNFLVDILSEIVGAFSDELLFLGGDEVNADLNVGYKCFDRDAKVSAWLQAQNMTSRELLDYFWRRLTTEVLPALPQRTDGRERQIGVWFCDEDNLNGNGLYPPPPLGTSALPPGTLANVYQNISTAQTSLRLGAPTVLSLADDGWYVSSESSPMKSHGEIMRAWSLEPCDWGLNCSSARTQELLVGGEADVWMIGISKDSWEAASWHGVMAIAERLWSPPLPPLSGARGENDSAVPGGFHNIPLTSHTRLALMSNATRRMIVAACHMRVSKGTSVAPIRPSPSTGASWALPLEGSSKLCGDARQIKGEQNVCRCPSDWWSQPTAATKTDDSTVDIQFGTPVLVATSRASAQNASGVTCWCNRCSSWDFPRLYMLGRFAYVQVENCNDADHDAWNYYGLISPTSGHTWLPMAGAGASRDWYGGDSKPLSALGPVQNGVELMVMHGETGIGVPYQLFYANSHRAVVNASKYHAAFNGQDVYRDSDWPDGRTVSFEGFPYSILPRNNSDEGDGRALRTWTATNHLVTNANALQLADGCLLTTLYFEPKISVAVPGHPGHPGRSYVDAGAILAMASCGSERAWTWKFRGIIASDMDSALPYKANYSRIPSPGPTENNLAMLGDRRILCVMRVRSPDDDHKNGILWRTFSVGQHDGTAWEPAVPMRSAAAPASSVLSDPIHPHSVQPKLLRLRNGVTLLSSGRYGNFVWGATDSDLGRAGLADRLTRANVAKNHNDKAPAQWAFAERWVGGEWANTQTAPSTGYTGLAAWNGSNDTALLCYDKSFHYLDKSVSAPRSMLATDSIWCVNVTARHSVSLQSGSQAMKNDDTTQQKTAFFLFFASMLRGPDWPHKFHPWQDGLIVMDPTEATADDVATVKRVLNATVLMYFDAGDIGIKDHLAINRNCIDRPATGGCNKTLTQESGEMVCSAARQYGCSRLNCTDAWEPLAAESGLSQELTKRFDPHWALSLLPERVPVCENNFGLFWVPSNRSVSVVVSTVTRWAHDNNYDGLYLDVLYSPSGLSFTRVVKALERHPGGFDCDGDGRPDSIADLRHQSAVWTPVLLLELRQALGPSKIILADNNAEFVDHALNGLTINFDNCVNDSAPDGAGGDGAAMSFKQCVDALNAAARVAWQPPLSVIWLTHPKDIAPDVQCSRLASIQGSSPWVIGGSDYYDGGRIMCRTALKMDDILPPSSSQRGRSEPLARVYNVVDYGARCDGRTDDLAAIKHIAGVVSVAGGALLFPGQCAVGNGSAGQLQFSTTLQLMFPSGAQLIVREGIVATVGGSLSAPLNQIFAGNGKVQFATHAARQPVVYSEWFGCSADGVTDNSLCLQAAINATQYGRFGLAGVLQLLSGTYRFDRPISIRGTITFRGVNRQSSSIDFHGKEREVALIVDNDGLPVHIEAMSIDNHGRATVGIMILNSHVLLRDLFSKPFVGFSEAIVQTVNNPHGIDDIKFEHLYFTGSGQKTVSTIGIDLPDVVDAGGTDVIIEDMALAGWRIGTPDEDSNLVCYRCFVDAHANDPAASNNMIGFLVVNAQQFVLRDSYSQMCGTGIPACSRQHAVSLHKVSHGAIEGNFFDGGGAGVTAINVTADDVRHVRIASNNFHRMNSTGITLYGGTQLMLGDNGMTAGGTLFWPPDPASYAQLNVNNQPLVNVQDVSLRGGISHTTVRAHNLCGECEIRDPAMSCDVVFDFAESDSKYFVTVSYCDQSGGATTSAVLSVAARKLSGFTIRSSARPGHDSVITACWHLLR